MNIKNYFKENTVKLSDKENIAVRISGLITAARLYSGMSQGDLARSIGTQQPSIARAEKGEIIPSIEFLYKISKAIKTDFIFPGFALPSYQKGISGSYHNSATYNTKNDVITYRDANLVLKSQLSTENLIAKII